jgi:hypothetical protein
VSEAPTYADCLERSGAAPAIADRWLSPDMSLLGDGRRRPPEFPLSDFGPFWSEWIAGAAKAASAPFDYVAVSLLTSCSAVIANARWPQAGAGWKEPPILWAALVGSPSSGKSPALDAAMDLVRYSEDQMAFGFDERLREFEAERTAANARRDEWERAVRTAIKDGSLPPPMPADATCPEEIVRPRVRVADATTEKLGALAACHERGLLLVRDELSGWLGAFDKYGGGGADRAFAIEMYGGRSYVIDRMKNHSPLMIPRLSISVVGGIQPDKLAELISGPDDGLIARFLWCWPAQDGDFSLCREAPDYGGAKRAFARLLDLKMFADEQGNPQPLIIRLESDAEDLLEDFARRMKRAAVDACNAYAGALGKARGHVLRLGAVIEYLWWSGSGDTHEPEIISYEAVRSAVIVMEQYFLPMAERAFGDASLPAADRNAIDIIKSLRAHEADRFNARELRRKLGGPLREAQAVDAACAVLEEAGLIRPVIQGGGHRPRKDFHVNPRVFGSEN